MGVAASSKGDEVGRRKCTRCPLPGGTAFKGGFLLLLSLPLPASPIPPAHADHGMVVSVHEQASRAGVDILRAGGNAIDAAVATGFALAVVHPQAGNLGGGGFMLVRIANGVEHFLDYREKAPAKASANMYLDGQGNVIPNASLVGYRAIAVPGSVAGMVYAQKNWGKLPLARVMAPAIRLARQGFALDSDDADALQDTHLAQFAESRRIFQRKGNYYHAGETLRQPELARTLARIARNPGEFYHGAMARELAASIQKGGGLVTAEDLANYEVKERPPIHGTYRGYEIVSAPPPSSGGTALVEILNILEGYDLSQYGDRSAPSIHLIAEAFRRAFYDRAEFMGDPDFSRIPVAPLIDKRYAKAWREGLNPEKATPSAQIKRPAFSELDEYAKLHPCRYPCPVLFETADTTHYSVVDSAGNAVAVTTTLNGGFGSFVTAEGLGFLLNNEMDDFSSKPGVPNAYGLIQGPANAIGPGRRPLSAMTPTIVLRPPLPSDKRPEPQLFVVAGSPGGPRIISTVANILIGLIDYRLDIQQAVDAPRFHQQWLPDDLPVEPGISPNTISLLENMDYKVIKDAYWSDGECILVDSKTGERLGASDARNHGKAIGY